VQPAAPGGDWERQPPLAGLDEGPTGAFLLALENLDDLIDFYEEQGRVDDMEAALRKRVELALKLGELHALAEYLGPMAAIREYYVSIDRPDRALEHELHGTAREIGRVKHEMADLDSHIAKLTTRREALERELDELHGRQAQLHADLRGLYTRSETEALHALEFASKRLPAEIEAVSTEISALQQALSDVDLPPDERSRVEQRHADLVEHLLDLKCEQTETRDALKRGQAELGRRREREREEHLAGLREELARLHMEKLELQEEEGRALRWADQRLDAVSSRMDAIRSELEAATRRAPDASKQKGKRAPRKGGGGKTGPKPKKARPRAGDGPRGEAKEKPKRKPKKK
jgi:chromosome segregation ATPase